MVDKTPKRDELLAFNLGEKIKTYEFISVEPNEAEIITPIGKGGSGIVYLASQKLYKDIKIKRAIKFFMYDDHIAAMTKHKYTSPISSDEFLNEIMNVSTFSHENIIKVTDAGIYDKGQFSIPFIVTEYIEGLTLKDIFEIFDGKSKNAYAKKLFNELIEYPELILEMLVQIGNGLTHIHNKRFLHCDIAPKNIFIKIDDNFRIIIGDLGLGRSLSNNSRDDNVFVAGSKDYMPPVVIENLYQEISWAKFSSFFPFWDLYGFSKIAIKLLTLIPQGKYVSWKKPLIQAFESCLSGKSYQSVENLLERINWLHPIHREVAAVPELSASLSGKRRILMAVELPVTSERLRKLIRHPGLLRLSRVPQLTRVFQFFPSATHTRYEHSLGVMETLRKYLIALIDQEDFLEHLSREKIITALICALLSNITRFPFSNIVHEIKKKHGEMLNVFSRKFLLEKIFNIEDQDKNTIPDLLEIYFPSTNIDNIKRILLDEKESFRDGDIFVHSLLNSSLDARVIDFVRRDSIHLGITKGDPFDIDELLPHLAIMHDRLALRITGLSVAEQIISLRYWLFNRIYWSRPNRALASMIRYLILELASDKIFIERFLSKVISYGESELVSFFKEEAMNRDRLDLVDIAELLLREQQGLFRLITEIHPLEKSYLSPICETVAEMNYTELNELGKAIAEELFNSSLPSGFKKEKVPVLVDMPYEPGRPKLGEDINVIRFDNTTECLNTISGIVKGVNDSFKKLRHVRIFVHPQIYAEDKEERLKLGKAIENYLEKILL